MKRPITSEPKDAMINERITRYQKRMTELHVEFRAKIEKVLENIKQRALREIRGQVLS